MSQFSPPKINKQAAWRVVALAAASAFLSITGQVARAADGDLDLTFGNGGKVVTELSGNDWLGRIAVQSDGKIVAAGVSNPGHKYSLARYNPDGTLDPTFGTGGKVTTVLSGNVQGGADGLLLLPDGKIMVCGTIYLPSLSDSSFALLRYNSDGSLDPTFGNGGVVATNVGPDDDQAYRMALQSDGKVVAAGRKGIHFYPSEQRKGNVALARYNPDGSLDATFGNGGKVINDFGQGLESYALALIIQPDGRIVIAGESSYVFLVARYNPNGTLDPTFNNSGFAFANFSSNWDGATDAVLHTDGKITLVGWSQVSSPSDNFALVRYNPDGSFDQSFGNGGQVLLATHGDLNAAALQKDGKLLALGSTGAVFQLLRFDSSGSLDATFGNGGTVTTSFGASAEGRDLVLQPDGKILAAGFTPGAPNYQNGDFAIARYLNAKKGGRGTR